MQIFAILSQNKLGFMNLKKGVGLPFNEIVSQNTVSSLKDIFLKYFIHIHNRENHNICLWNHKICAFLSLYHTLRSLVPLMFLSNRSRGILEVVGGGGIVHYWSPLFKHEGPTQDPMLSKSCLLNPNFPVKILFPAIAFYTVHF